MGLLAIGCAHPDLARGQRLPDRPRRSAAAGPTRPADSSRLGIAARQGASENVSQGGGGRVRVRPGGGRGSARWAARLQGPSPGAGRSVSWGRRVRRRPGGLGHRPPAAPIVTLPRPLLVELADGGYRARPDLRLDRLRNGALGDGRPAERRPLALGRGVLRGGLFRSGRQYRATGGYRRDRAAAGDLVAFGGDQRRLPGGDHRRLPGGDALDLVPIGWLALAYVRRLVGSSSEAPEAAAPSGSPDAS